MNEALQNPHVALWLIGVTVTCWVALVLLGLADMRDERRREREHRLRTVYREEGRRDL